MLRGTGVTTSKTKRVVAGATTRCPTGVVTKNYFFAAKAFSEYFLAYSANETGL